MSDLKRPNVLCFSMQAAALDGDLEKAGTEPAKGKAFFEAKAGATTSGMPFTDRIGLRAFAAVHEARLRALGGESEGFDQARGSAACRKPHPAPRGDAAPNRSAFALAQTVTTRTILDAMKRVVGWLVAGFGVLFLAMAASLIADAFLGKDVSDSVGGAVVLLVLACLSGFGAWTLIRKGAAKRIHLHHEELERLALAKAKESGGKLTEAELALAPGMNVDLAKKTLEHLLANGLAELEIGPSGSLVYSFPGLRGQSEKAEAKPVEEV